MSDRVRMISTNPKPARRPIFFKEKPILREKGRDQPTSSKTAYSAKPSMIDRRSSETGRISRNDPNRSYIPIHETYLLLSAHWLAGLGRHHLTLLLLIAVGGDGGRYKGFNGKIAKSGEGGSDESVRCETCLPRMERRGTRARRVSDRS